MTGFPSTSTFSSSLRRSVTGLSSLVTTTSRSIAVTWTTAFTPPGRTAAFGAVGEADRAMGAIGAKKREIATILREAFIETSLSGHGSPMISKSPSVS
jgi:hypothetical protein